MRERERERKAASEANKESYTYTKSTLITTKFLSCMMYSGATWRPGSHGPKHFEKISFL